MALEIRIEVVPKVERGSRAVHNWSIVDTNTNVVRARNTSLTVEQAAKDAYEYITAMSF